VGWSCDVVGKKSIYVFKKKNIPEAQTTRLTRRLASFGVQMVCEVCAVRVGK